MKKDPVFQKLLEHDKRFDKIDGRLGNHDETLIKLVKKLSEHDEHFDKIESRLGDHDESLKKLVKKLFDHDDRFVKVHEEIRELRDDMNTRSDEMLTILRRLDDERVASYSRFERIEKEQNHHKIKLADHDKSIIVLKNKLKVA